ncbi:KTSC domain-containing protein [Acidocella sp.]|jgi:hypothetical protein|uniref:KTSC domain-containing protein n=1 Tax=Acidocella sp. TaxID=50710 RepID=UPI002F413392
MTKHVHDTPGSSHTIQWEHDDETGVLTIHFADGSSYDYENVPHEKYLGATTATSKGQYFHRHIKKQHTGTPRR